MEESDNDWRIQDIFFLTEDWTSPWTGEINKKGSQVTLVSTTQLTKKKQLTIAIPNATAICISASRRIWKEALEIRNTSKIDRSLKSKVTFNSKSEAFDYIERIMESIIMAYTALESFVNERIPDDFNYEHTNRKNYTTEVMDKQSIERWLSLNEKLSDVLPLAIGIQSPKGSKCWHSYHRFKKIRDRIIHMKKEDRRPTGPEIPTLWHETNYSKWSLHIYRPRK